MMYAQASYSIDRRASLGLLALLLGGIVTALCLSTDVWSGPIAQLTGYIDLSVPAGMLVSAGVYAVLQRTALGKAGRP